MNVTTRSVRARRLVVGAASGALIVTGLAPLSSATAAAASATTVLTLSSKTIAGVPASVAPGYHTFVIQESKAQLKKDPRGLDVLQLAKGYTVGQFEKDGAAAFGPKWTAAAKKDYARLLKNTTSLGGLELEGDYTATGTSFTVLLKPGTYVLDNGPTNDGAPGTRTPPSPCPAPPPVPSRRPSARSPARSTPSSWSASRPASTCTPCTTRARRSTCTSCCVWTRATPSAEIQAALSGSQQPPSWVHSAGFAGLLSGGQTMYTSLNFSSKSQYLLLCFMPDAKTGVPHADLGMLRLFTVK